MGTIVDTSKPCLLVLEGTWAGSCLPDYGIDYAGGHNIIPKFGVKRWEDCALACYSDHRGGRGCNAWTFSISGMYCLLKAGSSGRRGCAHCISGPYSCTKSDKC